MNRFNFPCMTYCEPGLLDRLSEIPQFSEAVFNGHALLVTDLGLKNTDIPGRVQNSFKKIGIETTVFSNVRANPADDEVEEGTQAFRECGASLVIGLGGGSPLDVAKTIAVRLNHSEPMENYDDLKGGDSLIVNEMPPIIAIPTTAGTGSEVSRSSVIHIHSQNRKVVIFSPRMMPDLALLDPELTVGLPSDLTAFTGIDALTHLLEAYVSKGYHPMADGIALEGIEMVFRWLPEAYNNGKNIEARKEMLVASLMGGVAFQKGLGAAHSMAHPLSSVCGLGHGLANALVLEGVIKYNRNEIGERRFQKLSLAASPGKNPSYDVFMDSLEKLIKSLNIPRKLSDAGVEENRIDEMVSAAMQDGCHLSNPREVDEAAFRELYLSLM